LAFNQLSVRNEEPGTAEPNDRSQDNPGQRSHQERHRSRRSGDQAAKRGVVTDFPVCLIRSMIRLQHIAPRVKPPK